LFTSIPVKETVDIHFTFTIKVSIDTKIIREENHLTSFRVYDNENKTSFHWTSAAVPKKYKSMNVIQARSIELNTSVQISNMKYPE